MLTEETPRFFATPAAFGKWLAANHQKRDHLLVGYHKVGSGRRSMTWTESVIEALRFGWIDGVRRRIDDDSYSIRFTPRKPGSLWSTVNIGHANRLLAEGRMEPAGRAAFEGRKGEQRNPYSFEQGTVKFTPTQLREFKQVKTAWLWFSSQTPSYQKTATWWVVCAKRPETQVRRLASLIEWSAKGEVLPQYRWSSAAAKKRSTGPL